MQIIHQHTSIPRAKIAPSPTNPRKTFDDAKLHELAESMRSLGQQQDICVRPAKKAGHFELVYGERRWRAAEIADLPELGARVVDADDVEVLRMQIVENGLRADVHPIEEADAYLTLQRDHGYTTEKFVEEFGKSASHILGRLKVATSLCERAKKACLAGDLTYSVAEMIARVPGNRLQDLATRECLGEQLSEADTAFVPAAAPNGNDGIQHEIVETNPSDWRKNKRQVTSALSFRAAQSLLHRRYSLRLELAKFDTTDDELVKGVGACGPCANRSGNQPDLFPDLTRPADVCTNPSCFELKTQAATSAALTLAEEEAREVITDDATLKKVFPRRDDYVAHDSPYVDPKSSLPWELTKSSYGNGETWAKLLGKRIDEVTVVAPLPGGGVVELVDREAAVVILREDGKVKKPSAPAKSKSAKEATSKAAVKTKIAGAAFARCLAAIAEGAAAVEVGGGKKLVPVLRIVLRAIVGHGFGDDGMVVQRRMPEWKADHGEAIEKLIDKATGPGLLSLLAEQLATSAHDFMVENRTWNSDGKQTFEDLCELFGVSWEKQLELARLAANAEEKSDDAKAAKKGKK